MTIQKTQSPSTPSSTAAALSGNKLAGGLAQKARDVMESLVSPVMTTKLSELPTTKERLHALADAIEHEELVKAGIGFNMAQWYGYKDDSAVARQDNTQGHTCGTVACLAGWTALMEDGPQKFTPDSRASNLEMYQRAIQVLGIRTIDAQALFIPENGGYVGSGSGKYGYITTKQAVAVVRHFADTGNVRWNGFDKSGNPKIILLADTM